jgi:general secretion pathway protein D
VAPGFEGDVPIQKLVHAGTRLHVSTYLKGWVRSIAMVLAAAGTLLASTASERVYEQARQAERNGLVSQAYLLYSQAATLDPKNSLYALKASAMKPLAAKSVHTEVPDSAKETFSELTGPITEEDAAALERMSEPVHLRASPGTADFHLKDQPKALWEQVALKFGLSAIFDRDYPSETPIKFDITGADYRDALHMLEDATNSFVVPLSERVILIAQDNTQKRTDLEPNEAVMVPIPEAASLQEAQELATMIQQTVDMRRFVVDPRKRMIFMRDRVSKVETARALTLQLLHPKPQVAIEVELLNVTESSSLSLGMTLPSEFPLVYFGNFWKNAAVSVPATFTRFLTFGGGATLFGLGVTDAELFATASRSSGKTILNARILVADGQPGTIHVGDKYPIVQSGFYGAAPGATGQVFAPPPTVNFEDLGVLLKVTPTVHSEDEVSLEVDAEYKVLGSASLNGIPVIANRKFEARVRLKTSEYAIVSGLITESDSNSKTGIAGLADIPWLGWFFRKTDTQHDRAQTLLVIKPHIVIAPPSEYVTRQIWVGSETRPLTPL